MKRKLLEAAITRLLFSLLKNFNISTLIHVPFLVNLLAPYFPLLELSSNLKVTEKLPVASTPSEIIPCEKMKTPYDIETKFYVAIKVQFQVIFEKAFTAFCKLKDKNCLLPLLVSHTSLLLERLQERDKLSLPRLPFYLYCCI